MYNTSARNLEFMVIIDFELWGIPAEQRDRYEYDHREESTKTSAVTSLSKASSIRNLADEIKKCDRLLYADHKKKTAMTYVRRRITGCAPFEAELTERHARFNITLRSLHSELDAYDTQFAADRIACNYPSVEKQHEVIEKWVKKFTERYGVDT
jgi:hypothetical protein